MVLMPKPPIVSLEQRIAEKVSVLLAPSVQELTEALRQTNAQLAQLIEQDRQFRLDVSTWRQVSEKHQGEIATAINNLVNVNNRLILAMGGKLDNPPFIAAHRLSLPTTGTATQLPPFPVLYDKEVVIKADKDNKGTIYIGNSKSEAEDDVHSYPLESSESIGYKIKDLGQLWARPSVATDKLVWTTEKEE